MEKGIIKIGGKKFKKIPTPNNSPHCRGCYLYDDGITCIPEEIGCCEGKGQTTRYYHLKLVTETPE